MDEADGRRFRIDNVNGAAVGHVNAKANTALICDQAITAVKTGPDGSGLIDHTDALAVHLLRGNERRLAESISFPNFPMNAVQASERLRLVVRHLDAGDTQGETVSQIGPRAERRELLSRELACVHLPEPVVRVVRVVVFWTGCLSPA